MPIDIEDSVFGDTKWVAIRSRGSDWSWLTTDEAADLGKTLSERYGPEEKVATSVYSGKRIYGWRHNL